MDMDRGPIMPVPVGIRPVLSKYRIEVREGSVGVLRALPRTGRAVVASLPLSLSSRQGSRAHFTLLVSRRLWQPQALSRSSLSHTATFQDLPLPFRLCPHAYPHPRAPFGCRPLISSPGPAAPDLLPASSTPPSLAPQVAQPTLHWPH